MENELQITDPHLVETFHMPMPKVLVLGHGQHGKDTVAEMLRDIYGFTFQSSSRAALDAIYPTLSLVLGETDKDVLYEKRGENRELWKRLISLYNTPDKSALCRDILSKNDIYVGMRCRHEFEATRDLFDLILWVDAGERKPLDRSLGIMFNPAFMESIDNNLELNLTKAQVERLPVLREFKK